MRRFLWALLAGISLLGLTSCGGGSSGAMSTPGDPSVMISPTSVTLYCGETQQFTVTVTGLSSSAVVWAVNGVAGGSATTGTITASGLYTCPGRGFTDGTQVTVTATSIVDSTQSASATVTLKVITISLTPKTASVEIGLTQQFTVTANTPANASVTYSVNGFTPGNTTVGTINPLGLYTAPATVPTPAVVTVTATSTIDPALSCSATVTIFSGPATLTSVSPSTIGIGSFTLTLTGTNFVPGSQVYLGTTLLTTTFVSPTELMATGTATASMLGTQPVTVVNPGAPTSNGVNVTTVSAGVATVTSVSPATINVGAFTLTVTGSGFVSGAQVLIGGVALTTTFVSSTQLTATGTASATMIGLQAITVQNPGAAPSAPVNITVTVITGGASGSTGILVGTVNGQLVDKAYIPVSNCPALSAPCVAVVNIDSKTPTGALVTNIAMPAGYTPGATAASQVTNVVIVLSYSSSDVQIIDATKDVLVNTITAPVTGTVTFSGGSCTLCGGLVDPATNQFILDTAQGFLLFDAVKGTFSSILTPVPAENFAFNPDTQLILDPTYSVVTPSSGVQIISLKDNSVENYGGTPPTTPDSGTFDPTTNIAMVTDEFNGTHTFYNMQEAVITEGTAAAPGTWTAPNTLFDLEAVTPGCSEDWTYAAMEPITHLLFTAVEFDLCAGVETLPSAPVSGAPPAPAIFHWGTVPNAPDGSTWDNGGDPHGVAVFTSVVDGKAYGFLIEYPTQAYVARVDLAGIRDAALMAGTTNQVDLTPFIFFISTQ